MENNGFFGGAFGSSGSSGGGDTIYTANSSLTGNRDVNLDTNILTFKNGTSSLLEANSNGTLKFKNKLLISEFVGGVGDWANNVGFGHSALASTFNDDHAMIINQAGSVGINCPTGQRINFDQDNTVVFSLTPNGQFVYGSESVLGTEKVSLQGSTTIKGIGTSTGSTLALYNNDTTPVKKFDFKDSGDLQVGNSSFNLLGITNITIGNICDLTTSGDRVYFDSVSGQGGIKGIYAGNSVLNDLLINDKIYFYSLLPVIKDTAQLSGNLERVGFFNINETTPVLTLPRSSYGNHVVFSAPTSAMADANYNDNEFSFYVDSGTLKGKYKDNSGNPSELIIGGGASIYTADGTIGTGRVATLIDTLGIKTANTTSGFYVEKSTTTDKVFEVRGNGSGNWFSTSSNYIGIGEGVALTHSRFTNNGLDIYEGAVRKFRFQSGGNELINLFEDGSINGTGSHFVINSNAVIGTEKISLQSSTAIKGNGTSTGTALAIYDNDTTPNKLWDFLDNGVLNGNKSKTTLTAQNTTVNDLTQFVFSLKAQNGNDLMTVANDGYFQLGLSNGITGGADYSECFQVGKNNSITSNGSNKINVGIGNLINGATKVDQFIFGKSNTSSGNDQILLGQSISGGAGSGVSAVGNITTLTGSYSCALASYSNNLSNYSGILGVALESTANGAFVIGYGDSVDFNNKLVNNTADSLALGWNTTTPQYLFASTGASIDAELNMNNNRITNTIVNPSVQETTSTATFTINVDEQTDGVLTAMASATTIASPTGTPVQSQNLIFRFKDNGTARALTWNAIFRAIGITLPTTTTANKLLYVGCKYNSTDTKWDVVSVQEEA